MYTKQEIIIDSFRQGKSQRTIARDLQINRKTVKKYILEHEALLQSVCSKEAAQSETRGSDKCDRLCGANGADSVDNNSRC